MHHIGASLSKDEVNLLLTLPIMEIMPDKAAAMLHGLNEAGARPFTLFAFAAVGVIVTEENVHRQKPENLEKWKEAARIFRACNEVVSDAVDAYKRWLTSDLNNGDGPRKHDRAGGYRPVSRASE